MVTTKSLNFHALLGESPDDAILDDLADRIAARLRTPEKLTLSVTEAMPVLSLSRNTIYECCKTGEIPAVRFQGKWMISLPALKKKLEGVSNV